MRWRTDGIFVRGVSLALLGLLLAGCGGGAPSNPGVTIAIAPSSATVVVNGTLQFFAQVTGATDTTVKWFVNDVEGGDAPGCRTNCVGTISNAGVYRAPAALPSPANVTVKARANAAPNPTATATVTVDSGIRVTVTPGVITIGTGEDFQFQSDVTGVPPDQRNVNWSVEPATGAGTISATGLYRAPDTIPSPATVTIRATARADASRSATASATIITVTNPTLTSVGPNTAARGSLFQDIYLIGTNFISTTTVLLGATTVPGSALGFLDCEATGCKKLRVRLPDTLLRTAGTFNVGVQRWGRPPVPPPPVFCTPDPTRCSVAINSVRPALVGTSPDSFTQGGGATNFFINGGYFGPSINPVVTAKFNGVVRLFDATESDPRRLKVLLSRDDQLTPGLFSVTVSNNTDTSLVAAANVAVQPSPAITPPSVVTTLPVGTQPGAVAVNTATGFAVVANKGTNNLTLIDLNATPPVASGPPIAVGTAPTGVAVDNVRNLAVVANNGNPSVTGSGTVSIVDLAARTVTATLGTSNSIGDKPFSVAVNPHTGMALLVYQTTNVASLIDLTLNPPSVVGAVTVGTGTNPQAAIEPRLGWGVVTPGGAGSLRIVDTARRNVSAIAAAPTGAVRNNNVVTITTTAPHGLGVGQAVLIRGVSGGTFDGYFAVASVPSGTTFTFAQTGPNATGGGGAAVDLGRKTSSGIVATGAVRSRNFVTITTAAPHNLFTGQAVLITGVADPSFNGYFTVCGELDGCPNMTTTTFTYKQSVGDATSGGGVAIYANPVGTFGFEIGASGIAINPETKKAALTTSSGATIYFVSTLDQSIYQLDLQGPESPAAAVAVNPLTDITVTVNSARSELSIIDPRFDPPRSPRRLTTIPVGTQPKAVAIDPGSNLAVVANENPGGPGSVTVVRLGDIRPMHVTQVNVPLDRQFTPGATLVSGTVPPLPLQLTVYGKGFLSNARVRLDGAELIPLSVTDRRIDVLVQPSFLTAPRRYALDVLNPGGGQVLSNAVDFTVIRGIDVTSAGCTTPAPRAVAIDPQTNRAVVTNPGCDKVSLINLANGTVLQTVAVGANPQGVAVSPRLGKAVVTSRGSNKATILNMADGAVVGSPVDVGTEPIGVAINQETGQAVVTNSGSNNISVFALDPVGTPGTIGVDEQPVAVAVDSVRNLAVVASAASNTLNVVNLAQSSMTARVGGPSLPAGVAFDPVTGSFLATSSLTNTLFIVNPDTQRADAVRIGINPTSVAFNFQSSTLATLNAVSNTISMLEFQDPRLAATRVRAILGLGTTTTCAAPLGPSGSQQRPCGIEIHPHTNLAVIADGDNNRVLLLPLPR